MAAITTYLNNILSARYGKDVRQSIHDAIKQCYTDGKAGPIDAETEQRLQTDETNISDALSRLAGIETVLREMESEVYNVSDDFGAFHDGKTDDGDVLQNALDACRQHGGVLFFPAGFYVSNHNLTFYSNTVLLFAPGAVLTFGEEKRSQFLLVSSADSSVTAYNGVQNVYVIGATFDLAGRRGTGVGVGHANNVHFINCKWRNARTTTAAEGNSASGSGHYIEFNACANSGLHGCVFEEMDAWSYGCEYVNVDGAEGSSYRSNYNYDGTGVSDLTIEDCTFYSRSAPVASTRALPEAIGTHADYPNHGAADVNIHNNSNIVIKNNRFIGNWHPERAAIYFSGGTGYDIHGNIFIGSDRRSSAVELWNATGSNTIRDNHLFFYTGSPFKIAASSTARVENNFMHTDAAAAGEPDSVAAGDSFTSAAVGNNRHLIALVDHENNRASAALLLNNGRTLNGGGILEKKETDGSYTQITTRVRGEIVAGKITASCVDRMMHNDDGGSAIAHSELYGSHVTEFLPFDKNLALLWSGEWNQGKITVPNIGMYRYLVIDFLIGSTACSGFAVCSDDVLCGGGIGVKTDADSTLTIAIYATVSGETLTLNDCQRLFHNRRDVIDGGTAETNPHSAINTADNAVTITKIYGVADTGDLLLSSALAQDTAASISHIGKYRAFLAEFSGGGTSVVGLVGSYNGYLLGGGIGAAADEVYKHRITSMTGTLSGNTLTLNHAQRLFHNPMGLENNNGKHSVFYAANLIRLYGLT
ncbi:MAG: hypothetical protein IJ766_03965 [Clostridia bacterium]|nr:hypothetical protein [Clostridia bacterium]